MSRDCRRKLLGELLKEEQEPFVLEAFLQEKLAEVLRNGQRKPTTLGQLLLHRPVVAARLQAHELGNGASSSSNYSSQVSILKSGRSSSPCPLSMATMTRHHPLFNNSSSWRLVSPFSNPANRKALSLRLEAASGRVHGKLSHGRKRKKKKKKTTVTTEWKQRKRLGGDHRLGNSVRSLFSSLVKRKQQGRRREIAEGQHGPVSMGDILNWRWKPDHTSSRKPHERETGRDAAAPRSLGRSNTGNFPWREQGRPLAPQTISEGNTDEVLEGICHVDVLDQDEDLDSFVRFWGYANNPAAASCCCSEACSSSTTNAATSRHPSGSSFSCSSLSLSSSLCCDNRTADNLDEAESSPSSLPLQGGCTHQFAKEEEEDGRLLTVVGIVGDDEEAKDAAEAGPTTSKGASAELQSCSNNIPKIQRPCSHACSCGVVVVEAEKNQLSPVSVLELPNFGEEEDHRSRSHGSSCQGHEGGRREEKEAAAEREEEEVEDEGDDERDDYVSVAVGGDELQFQRSLTIVLESRKQILKKLSRFESLAAAAGIQPVNLDVAFAAFRQKHDSDNDDGEHDCCSSYDQGDGEREPQLAHPLRLRSSSSCTDDGDGATCSTCCDASPAEALPGSRLLLSNKFLVRACWEEDNVRSNTTIDMMVEADLSREGALAADWRGAGPTQAFDVAVGIESSIFTSLVYEFYHDLSKHADQSTTVLP